MIPTPIAPEKHIFVCVNEREGESCCSSVSGFEIFKKLKQTIKEMGLGHIWVTKTGCMGFCNDVGATIAIYPDKKLFTQVKEADIPKILEYVTG